MLLGLTSCGNDDPVVDPIKPPVNHNQNDNQNDDDVITSDKLAKQMTVTASLNNSTQLWTVNINSSLSMPGKTIKYGVTHNMTTSYRGSTYNNKVEWMYRYTGNDWKWNSNVYKLYSTYSGQLYGAVVFDKSVYASGSGSNYTASIENPYYNATYGINAKGETTYLENWWNHLINNDNVMNLEIFMEALNNINDGKATNDDRKIYEKLAYIFNEQTAYASYAKCFLKVFVEIDGKRYVVKEQEGKLRVPNAQDNPMDGNYPSNKN